MNRKLLAIVVVALLLVSTFAVAVSAATPRYSNGNGYVYNSAGTRVGYGYLWTNNVIGTDNGKVLSGQTICDSNSANYISAQTLAKVYDPAHQYFVFVESETAYSIASKRSPQADLEIPDGTIPLDARGIFDINGNQGGLCTAYNLGQGSNGACSDSPDCDFCDDWRNN